MRPTLRQLTQLTLAALFVLVGADAQLPPNPASTPAFFELGSSSAASGLLQAYDSSDFQLEPDDDFDTTDQGDVALEALGERWQSWTLSSILVGVERPPTLHSRYCSCHTPRAPPLDRSLA